MKDDIELKNKYISWKNKSKRLVLNEYFDSIELTDIEYETLKRLNNSNSYNDISYVMWNILDDVIKSVRLKLINARKYN